MYVYRPMALITYDMGILAVCNERWMVFAKGKTKDLDGVGMVEPSRWWTLNCVMESYDQVGSVRLNFSTRK